MLIYRFFCCTLTAFAVNRLRIFNAIYVSLRTSLYDSLSYFKQNLSLNEGVLTSRNAVWKRKHFWFHVHRQFFCWTLTGFAVNTLETLRIFNVLYALLRSALYVSFSIFCAQMTPILSFQKHIPLFLRSFLYAVPRVSS